MFFVPYYWCDNSFGWLFFVLPVLLYVPISYISYYLLRIVTSIIYPIDYLTRWCFVSSFALLMVRPLVLCITDFISIRLLIILTRTVNGSTTRTCYSILLRSFRLTMFYSFSIAIRLDYVCNFFRTVDVMLVSINCSLFRTVDLILVPVDCSSCYLFNLVWI